MKTSRQRLLEYIQTHRVVTVSELSRVLRMSRANARHHLAILEQQGLVQVVGERQAGRGRPTLLYGLAETTQAHNLAELSEVLLDMMVAVPGAEERLHVYRRIASALRDTGGKTTGGKTAGGKTAGDKTAGAQGNAAASGWSSGLTQRLSHMVQQLNQMNYQARWEAHAQGPRLILGHCPYAALLGRHPDICQIDRYLLQELVGAPVQQTERLALDERGAPYCRFALQTH